MKKLLLVIIGLGVLWAIIGFVKPMEAEPITTTFEESGAYASSDSNKSNNEPTKYSVESTVPSDPNDTFYSLIYMKVNGKTLGKRFDDYDNGQVYFDRKPISDAPFLRLDSVGPKKCLINTIAYQAEFDLSDPDVYEKMKDFLKPLKSVVRFQKKYSYPLGSWVNDEGKLKKYNAYYFFTLDFPNVLFEKRETLAKWLDQMVSISQDMEETAAEENSFNVISNPSKYKGGLYPGDILDADQLGKFASKKAYNELVKDNGGDIQFDVVYVTDYRAYILNDKLATYGAYVHSHEAFGHGMYTERFYSYDLENEKMVHNSNLFKKGTLDKVKWLVFEGLANNENYQPFNSIVPTAKEVSENIKRRFSDVEKFVLPNGALLPEGVVFSFQPYEIACFADGAIHVVVPYSKIKPYMTDWALSLIEE